MHNRSAAVRNAQVMPGAFHLCCETVGKVVAFGWQNLRGQRLDKWTSRPGRAKSRAYQIGCLVSVVLSMQRYSRKLATSNVMLSAEPAKAASWKLGWKCRFFKVLAIGRKKFAETAASMYK